MLLFKILVVFPTLSPLEYIIYNLNQRKTVSNRDKMTYFCPTKSPLKFFFFWFHFLYCFCWNTHLRAPFQSLTKVALKKFVAPASTKIGLFAVYSSSKRDKGFVIVCVTVTHTICHGLSAATTSRKYEPIAPDKTYISESLAARGS